MHDYTRRAVAYIAARATSGENASSVYDYDAGKYFNFSGTVEDEKVNVYDYDRSCYVGGKLKSLYHYGDSAYLDLKLTSPNKFEGYDYKSGRYFSGEVKNGRDVSLYDYDGGRYHSFAVS